MTFDDENKPKSQDFPNTQVPQALGNEVERCGCGECR